MGTEDEDEDVVMKKFSVNAERRLRPTIDPELTAEFILLEVLKKLNE